jgi:hypothetical protein
VPRETLDQVRIERDEAREAADAWQHRALRAETMLALIRSMAEQASANGNA